MYIYVYITCEVRINLHIKRVSSQELDTILVNGRTLEYPGTNVLTTCQILFLN